MDPLKTALYELGFLNKKGEVERNKERRWNTNINEAELILKDLMNTADHEPKVEYEFLEKVQGLLIVATCGGKYDSKLIPKEKLLEMIKPVEHEDEVLELTDLYPVSDCVKFSPTLVDTTVDKSLGAQ
jgi:hypothetical protein